MVDPVYCWVDMETTGLSAEFDVPLELGVALTDEYGFKINEKSWLVWEATDHFFDALERGRKDPFVNPMHEKSGLWEELNQFNTYSRKFVDEAVCDWLSDHSVKFGTIGMAGNSIGSLDRPFTLVHFPKFNEFLGYRNIDMSSFKEVCKRNNPELYENLKPIINDKENATHRVLGDIDAAISEFRAYLDNFLFI